ncbi:MAG: proline--tRNA ligase [Halobacteriovoraceae bacterium]|nr:proline--tRNA ligase [Halobacteriovoraceae bacterium]|tara:strand:+ start:16415 stop:18145 length:1731 start_codon:yes stop_codon:yes gene_type:complete
MRLSRAYWQTYKETPKDAEIASHRLLMRAGLINKTTSGIYSYLPFAVRTLQKIQTIIREELNKIGAQEVLMSFVTPAELWKASGRWETMGPEMIRLKDRKESDFCLSATNEETITQIFSNSITSYKSLPVNLYQINTKYRDEVRPRFGLLRCREFIMKDGYTFNLDKDSMDEIYESYYQAYASIFSRMNLEFIIVEADGGAMADAGAKTHEFQVVADNGEDDIVEVKALNYAANVETAKTSRGALEFSPSSSLEEVETKNLPTCAEVAKFLKIPVHQTLKTIMFTADYGKKLSHYLILLLGDDELNEIKLKNTLKAKEIYPTKPEVLSELDLPVGYMSPLSRSGFSVLVDEAIDLESGYVVGANKVDFHTKGFTPKRDLENFRQVDLRLAKDGDLGPDGKTPVVLRKGIEVGHIFQLGDKYSKSMNASVLDQNGKKVFPLMGCYGIGVSRTLAAAIEQNHDENGIVWPLPIAPYEVYFATLAKSPENQKICDELYKEMTELGIEVLMDDRGLGFGAMLKDADLLGLPVRVLFGERDYEKSGELEIKVRHSGEVRKVTKENFISELKNTLGSLGKKF